MSYFIELKQVAELKKSYQNVEVESLHDKLRECEHELNYVDMLGFEYIDHLEHLRIAIITLLLEKGNY